MVATRMLFKKKYHGFFSLEYVIIMWGFVFLHIVTISVLPTLLWPEKILVKTYITHTVLSKMCIWLCWLGVLGHTDRRKKQLYHSGKTTGFAAASAKAWELSPKTLKSREGFPLFCSILGQSHQIEAQIFNRLKKHSNFQIIISVFKWRIIA